MTLPMSVLRVRVKTHTQGVSTTEGEDEHTQTVSPTEGEGENMHTGHWIEGEGGNTCTRAWSERKINIEISNKK